MGKKQAESIEDGTPFEDLVVVGPSGKRNYYICKCVCGVELHIARDRLVGGKAKRCRSCAIKRRVTIQKNRAPRPPKVVFDLGTRCPTCGGETVVSASGRRMRCVTCGLVSDHRALSPTINEIYERAKIVRADRVVYGYKGVYED